MEFVFEKGQAKLINRIIELYNKSELYRADIKKDYDTAIYKLSILEIYFLEEIAHYGKNNIFRKYVVISKDECENCLEYYDDFMEIFTTDIEFSEKVLRTFDELSATEMFIVCVIFNNSMKQAGVKPIDIMLEREIDIYDPLNEINTYTKDGCITAVNNYFIGQIVFDIVSNSPKGKFKQLERGQFSSESKEEIISIIRDSYPDLENYISLFTHITLNTEDGRFLNLTRYNTNISLNEIIEKGKSPKEKK